MLKATILTVSDSRSLKEDQSGHLIARLLEEHTIAVVDHRIIKDDRVQIQAAYLSQELMGADLLIINGGTGVARRDVTISAIRPLLAQTIPGFGEAFRSLSFQEIGTRALASSAIAGFNFYNQLTYCLPGSKNACQTALTQLILPEVDHLIFERSTTRKEVHHHAH
ncbi:MAG: molybdenum cofactor biosynthesis protein B [Limosilactobacillus gorillae]|jgi:molybdopterin adenylyltransferase|uniref:MogA/MoaB family molybdenum cofactor biosynthesis protein n=1 Tax=Limosilactobacillus gorillae TaxID=1450649 RepID=UPI000B1B6737|nr:molybdenum cofactor biosynthesis protein B [Limosilactobacillus gorillae]MDO4856002.1 molybdenum cofactor biosynthesis protein B [Limosilactobacillus gorillae]